MKKIFPLLLAITWIIASCTSTSTSTDKTKTIVDALGRQVTIKSEPSRIVIAGKQTPMLTNFLFLFKTADIKLIAIEKRAQSTEDYLELVDINIGKKYLLEKGASAEQIAPLNPDIVILKTSMRDTIGKPLEDLSISVIYVDFENIDQIYRDIRIFGELLNESNRGEELVSNYQDVYQQIQQKVLEDKPSEKPSVLILQAVSSDQKYVFSVPAANWLQTNLIEKAEGIPTWKETNQTGGWSDINMEQISEWDPDMIFVINYQGKATEIVKQLKNDEIWQALKSVKNEKIYAFPFDYLSWDQPDPRWIIGYGWLAYKLNPQKITSSEIQSIIENFYGKFFLMDDKVIQEKIIPKIAEYLK